MFSIMHMHFFIRSTSENKKFNEDVSRW